MPLFIFNEQILNELPPDDPRINYYDNLYSINQSLKSNNSSILCVKGNTVKVWKELIRSYSLESVYVNKNYEPYTKTRDAEIEKLLLANGVEFLSYKDQVIHEENEVFKNNGTPYTVFTPYKNKWLEIYKSKLPADLQGYQNFIQKIIPFPSLQELGFNKSSIIVQEYDLSQIHNYLENRDFPDLDATSYLSPHLRFGTVSIRLIISKLKPSNQVFMNELIWREFFMQILFHFPHVVTQNFKSKYDGIKWLNNEDDFEKWCQGKTGYPLVDAGMRQLNKTGYMHNCVRMVAAGFLCIHLLIDWRLGEAYFAKKLLDFELSSNNGKLLASGSWQNEIIIWDLETLRILHFIKTKGNSAYSLRFMNNNKYLFSAGGNSINIWDIESETIIKKFEGQTGMQQCEFSPDGKYLVSYAEDHTVWMRDFKTEKVIWKYRGPQMEISTLSFSPDGKYLAVGTPESDILIWKLDDLIKSNTVPNN